MAGLFQVKELSARKRALVAESNLYRETLRLEVHHLGLRLTDWQTRFNPLVRWLPLGLSLLGLWRRREREHRPAKRSGWRRALASGLAGWRLYRRFRPVLMHFMARRNAASQTQPPAASAVPPEQAGSATAGTGTPLTHRAPAMG